MRNLVKRSRKQRNRLFIVYLILLTSCSHKTFLVLDHDIRVNKKMLLCDNFHKVDAQKYISLFKNVLQKENYTNGVQIFISKNLNSENNLNLYQVVISDQVISSNYLLEEAVKDSSLTLYKIQNRCLKNDLSICISTDEYLTRVKGDISTKTYEHLNGKLHAVVKYNEGIEMRMSW